MTRSTSRMFAVPVVSRRSKLPCHRPPTAALPTPRDVRHAKRRSILFACAPMIAEPIPDFADGCPHQRPRHQRQPRWPGLTQVSGRLSQGRSSTTGTGRHRRRADVRPDPRIPDKQGSIGPLPLQEITVLLQVPRLSPAPTSGQARTAATGAAPQSASSKTTKASGAPSATTARTRGRTPESRWVSRHGELRIRGDQERTTTTTASKCAAAKSGRRMNSGVDGCVPTRSIAATNSGQAGIIAALPKTGSEAPAIAKRSYAGIRTPGDTAAWRPASEPHSPDSADAVSSHRNRWHRVTRG